MTSEILGGESVFFKGGKQALTFMHGFTSTPLSVMPVAKELAQVGYTLSLPLLPGFGTTPEDMHTHSAQDWMQAALAAWDDLAREYPRPAVGGISMGGALALYVAAQRPVSAVVALSPALYLADWRAPFVRWVRHLPLWRKSIGNDIKNKQFKELTYSRFSLKSVYDLQLVMRAAREALPKITAPLLTMQSEEDHTIAHKCLDVCFDRAGSQIKEKHRLTDSYHVITMDNDFPFVAETMQAFLGQHQVI